MPSWALRFPHPGDKPRRPPDDHPVDADQLDGWWRARHAWDDYVTRLRKWEVACAIDMLERRLQLGRLLEPEQTIALNVGASWLDGSLRPPAA